MATRKAILCFGTSISGPSSDYSTWVPVHRGLDMSASERKSSGAYTDKFSMPGSFPGYSTLDLRGLAVSGIRYLTHYNPVASGYASYPGVCRVAPSGNGVVHTTTNVYFDQQFTDGSHNVASITRVLTGTTHTVTAVDDTPGFPTTGSKLTLTPALDPAPIDGEEFTHTFLAESNGTTTTAILNMGFGLLRDGDLTGLLLTCTSGTNSGQSRVISGWNATTNTATVAAFSSGTVAGNAFTITPQSGAFANLCYFLPWTPYEADLTTGRPNPYPPGFDFPNDWHTPQLYAVDGAATTTVHGVTRSMSQYVAYHVGLANLLREHLGETVYVIPCDFAGSSSATNDVVGSGAAIGWFDPSQQQHWDTSDNNACHARLLQELTNAKAAAAALGDTLDIVGVFECVGEVDAWLYEEWSEKFLDGSRTRRTKIRQAIFDLGMTSAANAASIPWTQPNVWDSPYYTYLATVNTAIAQMADEDAFGGTFAVDDLTTRDNFHFTGTSTAPFERRHFETWRNIVRASDTSGAVSICNKALAMCGESAAITSLDTSVDLSSEAALCSQFYDASMQWALEARNWSFALTRRPLAPVASDSSAWEFAYVMPADCVRPLSVIPSETTDDNVLAGGSTDSWPLSPVTTILDNNPNFVVPQQFSHEIKADGTRVIYSNLEDAHLRYVAKVTDTTRYTERFREAVQYKLASYLAGAILKGRKGMEVAQAMLRAAMFAVGGAAELDGANSRVRPKHVPKWFGQ